MTELADKPSIARLLIVDDDEGIREMLAIALEDEDYEVLAAESGNRALALLKEETVDLIISDMRMPDGDGGMLLDAVRADGSEKPKFILMSGFSDLNEADALRRGANAMFHKPYQLEALLETIAAELGQA